MGGPRTWLLLLMAGFYGTAARGSPYIPTVMENDEEGHALNNYNGWVNPEDLAAMPQCIAQQDHSTWLTAITECTSKQCTSKSVLGKAQLYLWISNVTSRTWLVDVGDANELQNLSPASLVEGYADVSDAFHYAPTCLINSVSALSREPYQHVMSSCMFTGSTQNTGNAARPWEYSESQRSMIALGFDTVGYNDLTRGSIGDGNYFDRNCFCSFFTIDSRNEPCSGSGGIDLTKERLWINATCGSTSLPDKWTDTLQTTEYAYIPFEDWHWPRCFADMPKQVTELPEQCAADACELDSAGYCSKVKPAVDRTCFCHNISYDSCGGSCRIFETRIDYIKWLDDMCGDVEDWHGLPDNWRQLAVPTSRDMIPWSWTVKPSKATGNCSSTGWRLGSLALINITTFLAIVLSQMTGIRCLAHGFLWHHRRPRSWYSQGFLMAAFQVLANYANALLVQQTLGNEDVPVTQLMLFWFTMPRTLAWLTILLVGVQPFETMNLSAAASCLFAEVILQVFTSYYMLMTVGYGVEHNFYLGGGMEKVERRWVARLMYHGALMWLMIIGLVLALLVWATHRMNRMTEAGSLEPSAKPQRDRKAISRFAEGLTAQMNERYTRLRGKVAHFWTIECSDPEITRFLIRDKGKDGSVYGTFSVVRGSRKHWAAHRVSMDLYAAVTFGMFLLWLAQWLFWGGLIGLGSEEYCAPKLGLLTAIWIAFPLAGASLGAP